MCEIDIGNLKTRNFTKLVQVRNFFYYLWVKGNSTWGERDIIFLSWLFHLPPTTTTCGPQPQTNGLVSVSLVNQPSSSEAGTQLTAFFSNLSQRFRCVTSPTSPGPNYYLRFLFWHLWMTHPLRARVNTCVNVAPN